jgi:hypothetical protein
MKAALVTSVPAAEEASTASASAFRNCIAPEPDVSALYHTNSDLLPPHILLSKWPKDNARPKSVALKHGEVGCLSFPLLFLFADSGYHPGLTLFNNRRMTRAQWLWYLIFNTPPHFVRQPRVLQEFILHVWNEIGNERRKYFRNVTHAAGVADDEDNVDEQERTG